MSKAAEVNTADTIAAQYSNRPAGPRGNWLDFLPISAIRFSMPQQICWKHEQPRFSRQIQKTVYRWSEMLLPEQRRRRC